MSPYLYLAPLHGITNRVFRKVFFRHFSGLDAAVAPFILSAKTAQLNASHFKDLIPLEHSKIPVIPQILSNDPVSFIATAKHLSEAGYTEINWNLGCPFPMVANKKRGSGLLPFPDEIDRFLDIACTQLGTPRGMPLSIKVRLGRKSADEFEALIPIFHRYPLKSIIIHPRIGIQMYEGKVDLDGFEKAYSALAEVPVYNGDIVDVTGFVALQERFPRVSNWMIGRGAISNPFLATDIKSAAGHEGSALITNRPAIFKAFHDDLFASYRENLNGPMHVLDKMKEIWSYLGSSFKDGEKELKTIRKATSFESYGEAVAILLIRPLRFE